MYKSKLHFFDVKWSEISPNSTFFSPPTQIPGPYRALWKYSTVRQFRFRVYTAGDEGKTFADYFS